MSLKEMTSCAIRKLLTYSRIFHAVAIVLLVFCFIVVIHIQETQ